MKTIRNLLFALLFTSSFCYAQEELPTISAARPGFAWDTETMPHHKFAWENGILFEKSSEGAKTLSLNGSVLRYGLFQNTEVYIGSGLQLTNDGEGWNFNETQVSPMVFGTKVLCYEGEGFVPSVGVLAEFSAPHIGSKELCPTHLAPRLYLLLQQSLLERLSLCYDAGLEWDGESAESTVFLAIGAWVSITDRLSGFVETNNYFHSEDGNQYLTEFGFTWLASRRVQLDIEADLDFQNLGKYYSIGCGVAWLLN